MQLAGCQQGRGPDLTPSSDTTLRSVPTAPDKAFLVASACMRVRMTSRGCTQTLMAPPDKDPAHNSRKVFGCFKRSLSLIGQQSCWEEGGH